MHFHILKSCKWSGDRRFAKEWPATGKRSEAETLRAVPLITYVFHALVMRKERAGRDAVPCRCLEIVFVHFIYTFSMLALPSRPDGRKMRMRTRREKAKTSS